MDCSRQLESFEIAVSYIVVVSGACVIEKKSCLNSSRPTKRSVRTSDTVAKSFYLLWPSRVIISAGSMDQDIVSKVEPLAVALSWENSQGIIIG